MLWDCDICAVDTETTGLNPWIGDRLFGISFATPDGRSKWVEWKVDPYTRKVVYEGDTYLEAKAFLEDASITKVFFNAGYDLRMLEFAGIYVEGDIEEASLAIRVCGVDRMFWKLKPLANEYFEIDTKDEASLKKYVQTLRSRAKLIGYNLGKNLEQDYWLIQYADKVMVEGLHTLKTYQKASVTKQQELEHIAKAHAKLMQDAVGKYGALDAVRTICTWLYFEEELKRKNLEWLYEEENNLLLNVTYDMIGKGIQVSEDAVKKGRSRARALKAKARHKLNTTFWNGFNPRSVIDKRRYFIEYKKLLPLTHSKKTMNPSIDEAFLEYYAKQEPGAKAIIEYVAAGKAKSTYFDWMLFNHDSDWILHPDLNQFGTLTGRYSGRFLTIPKRAKPGSIMLDVRRCFVPRQGFRWLLADYSQIESRIFADEFEEGTMLNAFAHDRDVYEELRDCILVNTNVDVGRQVAKNIFLGKIYGLGIDHMIEMIMDEAHTDIDSVGAEKIIEAFDFTFPGVNATMKKVALSVERNGFIRNRYGQTIAVPYDFAYKGVNYIIQSTAQRVIKRAMLELARVLEGNISEYAYMVLQIHDEIIFEVSNEMDLSRIKTIIETCMTRKDESLFPHVKLDVDFELVTDNWLERKGLDD